MKKKFIELPVALLIDVTYYNLWVEFERIQYIELIEIDEIKILCI